MSTKDTVHWMCSTLWNPTNPNPLFFLGISIRQGSPVPPRIPIRPQDTPSTNETWGHGVTFLAFHFEESLKRSAFHITH